MKLNNQQQNAFDLMIQFVESGSTGEMFLLKGYAGTGKTFTISHVIKYFQKKHPRKRIAITAPTNKAVQVLVKSSRIKQSEHLVYKTIHSLLGLKEVIKDSGHIDFEADFQNHESNIRRCALVIIDEVSMLDDKLFYEIKRYNKEIKIIMMGDPAQIPPVNKVDCEPFLNPEKHKISEFQLSEIMRQDSGSSIVENSFLLRNEIEKQNHEIKSGTDLTVYDHQFDRTKIASLMQQAFANYQEYLNNTDSFKIICWRNSVVNSFNEFIRELVHKGVSEKIVESDFMIANSPISNDKNEIILHTNQEFIVKYVDVRPAFLEDHVSYMAYHAIIEFEDYRSGTSKKETIQVLHPDSYDKFNKHVAELKNEAIRASNDQRKYKWREYYKLFRFFADVNHAYAITAHKSQGSTYEKTLVYLKDILMNPNIEERNRILYTAITRASKHCSIIA